MKTIKAVAAWGVLLITGLVLSAWTLALEPARPREKPIVAGRCRGTSPFLSHPSFTDITASAGVGDLNLSTGCAFGDMDNDGDLDLYLSNADAPNRLFENLGSNIFTDIAPSAGVTLGNRGCVFGDTDDDGDLDLFLASVGDTNRLYRNEGDCIFTNISASAGFGYAYCSFGPIWGDVNNDGLIDLFVTDGNSENKLYRNDGDNTFADITIWAGVGGSSGSYQGIFGDVDGDGDLDLYVVNRFEFSPAYNTLFQSDGSGRFTDVTSTAGVAGSTGNDQGTVFGDYDNDGDLDIFVAYCGTPNILYQNDGAGHFVDVAGVAGVADARCSISAAFGDLDNDGDLDLYVGNAHQANTLYQNNGDGTFTDVTDSAGVGDPGRNIGMALGDIEDDGDLDIYVTNSDEGNVMYRNNMDNCDFLKIRLVGTVSNRCGIGAKVTVYDCGHVGDPDHLVGFREVNAGSGIWSMNALESHFGVKEGNLYDVRVIFPSGIVVDSLNVAACEKMTIIETTPEVTPRDYKEDALAELEELMDQVPCWARWLLKRAIWFIRLSLDPILWVDDHHLNIDFMRGDEQVLDEGETDEVLTGEYCETHWEKFLEKEEEAAEVLTDGAGGDGDCWRWGARYGELVFRFERKATARLMILACCLPQLREELEEVIGNLLTADSTLAQVALDEAIAGGGNPWHIWWADWHMERAEQNRERGWFWLAIWHYGRAWRHAVDALHGYGGPQTVEAELGVPTGFTLYQNCPNPFSSTTDIRYQIPASCHITLRVFSVTGGLVKTLVDEDADPGYYRIGWDGEDSTGRGVADGIYFCRLCVREHGAEVGNLNQMRKMVMLK